MKWLFQYTLIILVLLSSSCSKPIPSERDQIQFDVPITAIEDSIKNVIAFLSVHQNDTAPRNCYRLKDNHLYLNTYLVGNIDTLTMQSRNIQAMQRFLTNVVFLNNNNITFIGKHTFTGCYMSSYREIPSTSLFDDNQYLTRDIMLVENASDTMNEQFTEFYKIIDRKYNLVLCKRNLK